MMQTKVLTCHITHKTTFGKENIKQYRKGIFDEIPKNRESLCAILKSHRTSEKKYSLKMVINTTKFTKTNPRKIKDKSGDIRNFFVLILSVDLLEKRGRVDVFIFS